MSVSTGPTTGTGQFFPSLFTHKLNTYAYLHPYRHPDVLNSDGTKSTEKFKNELFNLRDKNNV